MMVDSWVEEWDEIMRRQDNAQKIKRISVQRKREMTNRCMHIEENPGSKLKQL